MSRHTCNYIKTSEFHKCIVHVMFRVWHLIRTAKLSIFGGMLRNGERFNNALINSFIRSTLRPVAEMHFVNWSLFCVV